MSNLHFMANVFFVRYVCLNGGHITTVDEVGVWLHNMSPLGQKLICTSN